MVECFQLLSYRFAGEIETNGVVTQCKWRENLSRANIVELDWIHTGRPILAAGEVPWQWNTVIE